MSRFESTVRSAMVSLVPEQWLQKIRARRRAALFVRAGVVFVHIPRTAGTSITNALYGRFMGHFGLRDFLDVAPPAARSLPRFTIVRNPWDRAVSAWSFARAGGGNSASGRVQVHRVEQYDLPAFSTFERFVLEWLPQQPIETIDGIFRPQYCYFDRAAANLGFDHVGRLENLPATEHWLTETLGRPIAFTRQNASPREDYRSYYTARMRDEIARLYADDIAALGYSF